MIFREAKLADIPRMHFVRMSVQENKLSNPNLVKEEDYTYFITVSGKGWVCETDNHIVGFAIVDMLDNNVWALFVQPGYEGRGIGRHLHNIMMNWYFEQTNKTIWLSTAPGTRAEIFYREAGWQETGMTKSGEIRFEKSSVQ